jgi:hypothetical protein
MPMSEIKGLIVHRINAQIRRPGHGDPGQICVGYYVVDGDVLVMTNESGVKVLREDGTRYSHKLAAGEDPRPIAARFTKQIRRMFRGESRSQERFAKPLNYPKGGWM